MTRRPADRVPASSTSSGSPLRTFAESSAPDRRTHSATRPRPPRSRVILRMRSPSSSSSPSSRSMGAFGMRSARVARGTDRRGGARRPAAADGARRASEARRDAQPWYARADGRRGSPPPRDAHAGLPVRRPRARGPHHERAAARDGRARRRRSRAAAPPARRRSAQARAPASARASTPPRSSCRWASDRAATIAIR